MEKSGFVCGDFYAEYADVGILKDEMMVGFLRDWNGDRRLSAEGECEKKQE
jgi:hypothetical protein